MIKKPAIIFSTLFFSFFASASEEFLDVIMQPKQIMEITCQPETPVTAHMQSMNETIGDLLDLVDDIINYDYDEREDYLDMKKSILEYSQKIRVHLLAVLPLNPAKLAAIDPSSKYRSKLIFQSFVAEVLKITIELELKLTESPTNSRQFQTQQIELAGLVTKIDKTIRTAHSQYRDKPVRD